MEFILKGESNPITVNLDQAAGKVLINACKLAKKTHAPMIILSVNGKLDYTFTGQDSCSKDEVKNDGSIVAGYDHTGDDIRIAVNPIFLMQAIQGGKKSTLKFLDANSPMYYTDGENREAIIMAMWMDAA
jgi:DNA polymerase III sliding clamp (beta) subunit (PCNA family)